ncbi:MAG: PIN domain-containing protein [Chthoniobacterales bacterium]|nr:PIN domain-containing protein [Chthoniobacterales bacterium]
MKTLLLDANVLLALAWPNHPFHRRALGRIDLRSRLRWGTCLLTQAAFVRLSSNPAVIPGAKSPAEAGQMLQQLIEDRDHVFLEARKSARPQLGALLRRCQGHNQVNDAFLIWLASVHGGTVLTFDAPLRHLAPSKDLVELIA